MIRTISLLLVSMILTGCANPFMQYYQDRTGGRDLTKLQTVIIPSGEPKLFRGGDREVDYQRMLENGYNLVGFSSFNGADVSISGALTQAKAVHAEIALIYTKYTRTESGVLPLTLPDMQTSTTTLSGSSLGTTGYRTYSGIANTTTYGTRTTYIPYSTDRYDYFASYWIKMKPPVLGVHVRELTSELRQQIGSNKGVYVLAVVRNSPAWNADILKNDIIIRMSASDIVDSTTFTKAVRDGVGKMVSIEIIRDRKPLVKEVQFPSGAGYVLY